jgi:ribosomal protein L44E
MATTGNNPGTITEYCDHCESNTLHNITIQIRTESKKAENASFSREPYRISECNRCGIRESIRMNNA